MPPLPVIPDLFRVAFLWDDAAGGRSVNVAHFLTSASGKTPAQVLACLEACVTAGMWETTAPLYVCRSVAIIKLDGTSPTTVLPTAGGAKWTGGATGDAMPSSSALIKLQTAARGPANRGRLFLGPTGESKVSNGNMLSTAAMQTAWTNFLAAVVANATTPMTMMVASYVHGTARGVTNATVEGALATQRRRQTRKRPL